MNPSESIDPLATVTDVEEIATDAAEGAADEVNEETRTLAHDILERVEQCQERIVSLTADLEARQNAQTAVDLESQRSTQELRQEITSMREEIRNLRQQLSESRSGNQNRQESAESLSLTPENSETEVVVETINRDGEAASRAAETQPRARKFRLI